MEVSRQLLVIGVLATLGLLMKTIVFTTPGWAGVHIPVKKQQPMDMVMPALPRQPCDDGSRSGEMLDGENPLPPCDMIQDEPMLEAEKADMMTEMHRKGKRHHRHHHHCGPGVHMSLGLWYAVTCTKVNRKEMDDGIAAPTPDSSDLIIDRKKRSNHHHDSSEEHDDDHDDDDDDDDHKKMEKNCRMTSYKHADVIADNMPAEASNLADIVKNIALYTDKMLCEFRVEATIGLSTSFVGIFALWMYARGGARGRWSAIMSFMCLLTSGVIYLVAVGKVASILIMSHKYLESEMSDLNVRMTVPWGLILAVIGSLFTLVATFGMLLVLSRGHNSRDIAKPYAVGVNENGKYARFVNEEAGPLPMKVKF